MKRILMLIIFCATATSVFAQVTWTGAVDTNYSNPNNWNPVGIPSAGDDVVIPNGSTMTVNIAASIQSIAIQGTAVVNLPNSMTFTAASSSAAGSIVNWSAGNISGGSTFTNNGIFNLTTTSNKSLVGNTTFNNAGTFNITNSGDLFIIDGTFNNQSTGIIDMQVDGGNISNSGGSTHILNNYGIIKKTTSTGNADILIVLNNLGGTINVESGNLRFLSSIQNLSGGVYNVSAGSYLQWGSNAILDGTLTGVLDGVISWTGTVTVTNPNIATFNFTGNSGVSWFSGTLAGGGSLINQSLIFLTSTANKSIVNQTFLNNEGDFNITDSGDLFIVDGTFNNQPTGIIDMQVDGGNISNSGGSTHILNNYGIIKKTTSTGNADILIVLNNLGGTINVESGNLRFLSSIQNLSGGVYNVSAGSYLQWGSNAILDGTLTGVLDGEISWTGTVTVTNPNIATFNFTGNSGVSWFSGSLAGGGSLINQSLIFLTSTANKSIVNQTFLNNEGDFNITDSGDLFIVDGTFNNQATGVIDLQVAAGNITYSGGSLHTLNNTGLIKRTTTIGDVSIAAQLNNTGGTISVENGTLTLDGIQKNLTDGTYNVVLGSTLFWATIINVAGTLTGILDGEIGWTNTVNVPTTATFNFSGASGVSWSNGTLTGTGTLTNESLLFLPSTSNKSMTGNVILNNKGNFNITGSGDLFIVDGTFNNQIDGVIDMQIAGGDISYSGGSQHILNNNGLIKRTTTSGVASIATVLNNNNGTISVESGTLAFTSLNKNLTDGIYNVSSGSILNWAININVAGTLTGVLDGEIGWTNTVTVPTAATFNFSGASGVSWSAGTLTGVGTLTNESLLFLPTTNVKSMTGNVILNNNSNFNISDTGDLLIIDGTFNNLVNGVLDLQTDSGNISYSGGIMHILNNAGLLKKSAGTGSTLIYPVTTNSGTIEVMTGTLNFVDPLGLTNTVDGIIKGVGTIDIPAPANYTNNGTYAPGASPGKLTVIGEFKSSATSVLDVELNGNTQGVDYDWLAITGTNANFDGSVNVTMGFEGNVNDEFIIATTSGTIANCNLATPADSDFDGKRYSFTVACRNNNEVVVTITAKLDIQPPVVITKDISVPLDATGVATIVATDIDNGSNDNCSLPANLIYTIDEDTWNCSQLGDHTVTLTVEDEAGNSASATATVTVFAPTTTYTAGSWDNGTPNKGNNTVFNDDYTTATDGGSVVGCTCEITGLSTVTVSAGDNLNITSDVTVDGNLFVAHEGSFVQEYDTATVTNNGAIDVQKTTPFLDERDFMILGSPMSAETRSGVYGTSVMVRNHITANFVPNPDIPAGTENFADDNGDNFVNYSGSINVGEGYLVRPQTTPTGTGIFDLDYTLGTLNNGVLNFNVIYNGTQNASLNVLGNPYASAIDTDLLLTQNSTFDAVYFWEHLTAPSESYPGYNRANYDMGDISMYNAIGGVAAANDGTGTTQPTNIMASGQGFGIKASAAGTAVFNNSMRVTGPNDTYRNVVSGDRIWLNVINRTYHLSSNVLVGFTEEATDGFDNRFDAKRLATPVSLYSELGDGHQLAIQGRSAFNEDQELSLGFSTQIEELNDYTISILGMEGDNITASPIFLKDNLSGIYYDLLASDYSFSQKDGTFANRFSIMFQDPSVLGTPSNVLDQISIFPNPAKNVLNISSANSVVKNVEVLDIQGRIVISKDFSNTTNYQIDLSSLSAAMYLVKINTENGSITKRVIKQ